jgi:hypothetical protein
MSKDEIAQDLENLVRSYYLEFPFGHSMTDAHNSYSRGKDMWNRINKLSFQLEDNHEYLSTIQKALKEEGILREIY